MDLTSTLGIFCPHFKRTKVLRLWLEQISRLRQELSINLPACVISEEDDKDLCGRYHVNHITQRNVPVTGKFNRGTEWVRDMGFDYALISGSDNLFSNDTIKRYLDATEEDFDLIGIKTIYFYAGDGQHRGKLIRFDASVMLGVGKCISRRVLEAVDWKPWNKNRNYAMDAIASQNIRPHVKTTCILSNPFVCDVKTRININKISLWTDKATRGRDPRLQFVDPQELYKNLSDKEKERLFTL
jgi:hypothetical protein